MRSLSIVLILLLTAAVSAEEPIIPGPAPAGEVDAVTQRRAAEALAILAQEPAASVAMTTDVALLERMAEIEGWLRETGLLLDQHEAATAGDRFMKVGEAMKALTPEERAALGRRYVAARDRLQGFARLFAEVGVTESTPSPAPAESATPPTDTP